MFLLRLFGIGVSCRTCTDVSFTKKKAEQKKESQTFFLLSLNCHQRSAESACRDRDSAEGLWSPGATPTIPNCPKPHPVQKEKTCTFSSGGTHELMWSQLPIKQSCSRTRTSRPNSPSATSCRIHVFLLFLTWADLVAAVETSEASGNRKQTKPPMCRHAKPIFDTE